MSDNESRMLNCVGGAGLGALIALLLSLSNTAVISSTLTVLLGAAVVFLALQDKISIQRADSMTPALLYRITGFAVAGIVALLIGLHLRASNTFGDRDTVRLYSDLVEIGISKENARTLILERLKGTAAPAETETERLVHSTTLFSSDASSTSCENMDPSLFKNVESLIVRYTAEGGEWRIIANTVRASIRKRPEIDGVNLAKGLHLAYCAEH